MCPRSCVLIFVPSHLNRRGPEVVVRLVVRNVEEEGLDRESKVEKGGEQVGGTLILRCHNAVADATHGKLEEGVGGYDGLGRQSRVGTRVGKVRSDAGVNGRYPPNENPYRPL